MTVDTMGVRINRRGLGVVGVAGDEVVFHDTRHLASARARAVEAAHRYILGLVERLKPSHVAFHAPTTKESVTRQITGTLTDALHARGVLVSLVDKSTLFTSMSATRVRHRREVSEVVLDIWPMYRAMTGGLRGHLADAVATALYAETNVALRSPP